jgi:hypothetical protein
VVTGVPDSTVDPGLAAIFAQVRENVDRFRLLLDEYPFRYTREEQMVLRLDPGGDSTEFVDTVSYMSRALRHYRVGSVIYVDSGPRVLSEILPRNNMRAQEQAADRLYQTLKHDAGQRPSKVARDSLGDSSYVVASHRRYMYLPTFRDLADSAFLAAHCFTYGGTRSPGGSNDERLIQIDFRPARAIATADVEGSVYLDAQRLVVRRAVFEMTKPDRAEPPLLGLSVTTTFRELLPLLPVFDSVNSQQPLPDGVGFKGPVARVQVEDDRLLTFTFEGQSPGQQPPTPGDSSSLSAAATVPAESGASRLPGGNGAGYSSGAAPLPAAVLTGRVLRTDGAPVSGAAVGLLASADSTATSDSGTFVLHRVTPGAHMLWVHGVGFEPTRVAVTLSVARPRTVTITVAPALHILAPVVTTERFPVGYADVGLDKRIQVGIGQFLTLDQIEDKHAIQLTDLLQGMRGIEIQRLPNGEAFVKGTRGVGIGSAASCWTTFVDGVPQSVVGSLRFPRAPVADYEVIDPADVGAIEVYQPSERPAGFNAGAQFCGVIAVWTRTRLGLAGGDTTTADGLAVATRIAALRAQASRPPETIAEADFPRATACQPPTAIDTTRLNVYAILQSGAHAVDSAWLDYSNGVFSAFRQAFVLPSQVTLPVFGYASAAVTKANWKPSGLAVAPTLSSVVSFTLGPTGALVESHVAVSSLAAEADTSILAAVEGAASTHAFPAMPPVEPQPPSVRFDAIVTTRPPDSTQHGIVVGQIKVPEWALLRAAALAPGSQPVLEVPRASSAQTHDSATFEFVIDETGKPNMATARVISRVWQVADSAHLGFIASVVRVLPAFRFEPAEIGACPVRQLTLQLFAE